MMSQPALQIIIWPVRPHHTDAEIDADIADGLNLLLGADGLIGSWQGKKYEERFTRVYLLLWSSLATSHTFFTSPAYTAFHKLIQPAMNGRTITWQQHALLSHSAISSRQNLDSILSSPAVEVAWTKVVEGGVAGYYERFNETVVGVLGEEPGCDGFFISPLIENPQDQMLLINWKSVDVSILPEEKS
ncbi:hypothetical protein V498_02114 [Pseudogymnoascus sp. VKM F-4517 (FW-2822)]|nr:hypothetical protein V498_02114 [Pseudogymnoascus sp. VKM F-4517 (FW-2822)]